MDISDVLKTTVRDEAEMRPKRGLDETGTVFLSVPLSLILRRGRDEAFQMRLR